VSLDGDATREQLFARAPTKGRTHDVGALGYGPDLRGTHAPHEIVAHVQAATRQRRAWQGLHDHVDLHRLDARDEVGAHVDHE